MVLWRDSARHQLSLCALTLAAVCRQWLKGRIHSIEASAWRLLVCQCLVGSVRVYVVCARACSALWHLLFVATAGRALPAAQHNHGGAARLCGAAAWRHVLVIPGAGRSLELSSLMSTKHHMGAHAPALGVDIWILDLPASCLVWLRLVGVCGGCVQWCPACQLCFLLPRHTSAAWHILGSMLCNVGVQWSAGELPVLM